MPNLRPGVLLLPPVGALIGIEFEASDPNIPIWSGYFWQRVEDMPAVYHRGKRSPDGGQRLSKN